MKSTIAILGAGSWGTALALHLARQEHRVNLWAYNPDHASTMATERVNSRYFPDYPFPPTLYPAVDLGETIKDVQDILIAVPSVGFRNTLNLLKPIISKNHRLIIATKGLDLETGQLFHEIVNTILGNNHSIAILSGPSFANEVAANLPTAVVIASQDAAFANDLSRQFNSLTFRVYISADITGVEIGGAVKNVLAIAVGISDGMGFGANARAALITRGLAEIIRLGLALGAQADTFVGLSGMGDLVLTCTDNQSRNRRFGLSLGKGKTALEAEKEIGQVIEGKRNAELVVRLATQHQVEMPISDMVLKILKNELIPKEAMRLLLSREPRSE